MKVALAWFDLDDPTDRAVALGLGRELEALGHDVLIVGPRRRRRSARREWVAGMRVARVGHPIFEVCPPLADAVAALQLTGLWRRERPDVWHCHVFGRRHRALAWAAAAGRWPLLATLHLVLPDYLAAAGGKRGLGGLLRRAFHVTAVSRESLDRARKCFPEIGGRSSIVGNGIERRDPAPPGAPVKGAPFILATSRLAPYKGLDVLLMAFAGLKERARGLKLVLAGRDQMRGGLGRFARALGLEGRVVFAGELDPPRVRSLLESCLLFVLPSRRENMPLALMEAMAAGKAVVASRVGGVPDVLRHRDNGLLVAAGDVASLSRAMEELAGDPDLRGSLGRRARESSRDFEWSRAAKTYVELYGRR